MNLKKNKNAKALDIIGTYTENPFTIDTLQPKTNYDVSVKVTDSVGKTATSEPVQFKTLPPSPIILSFSVVGVDPKQSCVEVKYKVTAEGVLDKVRVYANDIYVGNNSNAIENDDGSYTITITSLLIYETYVFYIEVYDKTGQFTKSDPITYTTYPIPPLITDVETLSISQTTAKFEIFSQYQTPEFGRYSYQLNGGAINYFTLSPVTITGLTRDTEYTISFIAYDGLQQPSEPFDVKIKTYPLAPVIVSVVVNNITTSGGTIITTATSVGGIKRYMINYEGISISSLDKSYTIADMAPYTSYPITVDVEDIFGQVTRSSIITFKTRPYPMVFNSYTVSDIIENGAMFEVDVLGSNGEQILAPLVKTEFYNGTTKLFGYSGEEYVFYIYDLMPGTTYSITKAIVTDEAGQTAENTTAFSFTTIPSELTISAINVSNITYNSAYVSIDFVAEAEIKTFKYKLDSGTNVTVSDSFFTITNLIDNTTYKLTITIEDIFKQIKTLVVNFKTAILYRSIDFDTDGGVEIASVPIANHGTINVDSYITTKYGYSFDGWYIGNVKYTGVQVVDSDKTYTAHWTKIVLTVKFLNWDKTVLKTQQVDYGNSALAPTVPPRTGYTFDSWDKSYFNVIENLDVNTVFVANKYMINFNAGAGALKDGDVSYKEVFYDSAVGVLPTAILTGALFLEWNSKEDGTGVKYTATTIYKNANNTVLYAKYNSSQVNYYVDFDTQANYIGQIGLSEYNIIKPTAPNTVSIGNILSRSFKVSVGTGNVGTSAITIEKTYVLPKGDYTFLSEHTITGLTTNNVSLGNISIVNASTGTSLGSIIATTALTQESSILLKLTTNTTIKVSVTIAKSSVNITTAFSSMFTFDLYRHGNMSEVLLAGTTIVPPAVIKVGYVLDKWYLDSEYTQPFVTGTVIGNADVSLYAKLNLATYNVTMNGNNGTTPTISTLRATYNTALGTLPTITYPGYILDSWKQNATGNSLLTFTDKYIWNDEINDYTMYARWNDAPPVVYNIGNPTPTSVIATLYKGVLAITGTGNTKTFNVISDIPWRSERPLIKSITFAGTVTPTNLDYYFGDCANLVNVSNTPNSVISIHSTFNSCTSLVTAPIIPNTVTNMSFTFYGCSSLINAPIIPDNVTNMSSTFSNCTSLVTAPIIPNSVTDMMGTFSNCTSLVSVPVIPNSVINMSNTFYGCTSLTTVPIIPNSVTNMSSTFNSCTSLVTAPIIPNSVINMGNTFYGCTSLTTVPIIPNSVTNMSSTFRGCTSLTGKLLIETNPTYYVDFFKDCSTNTNTNLIVDYVTTNETKIDAIIATKSTNSHITKGENTSKIVYNIGNPNPASVIATLDNNGLLEITGTGDTIAIGFAQPWYDNRTLIKSVTFADTVKSTNLNYYFSDCTSLISVLNIPDSSPEMYYVFKGCTSLVNTPIIPNGAINMRGTFEDCNKLTTISNMPNTVTTLSEVFYGCTSLINVSCISSSSVISLGGTFSNCTSLVNAPTIPNSVTDMSYTFQGCAKLKNIPNIPNSVINMSNTFYGCTSLVGVPFILSSMLTNMDNAFNGCTSLLYPPTLPNNSELSMAGAFQNCSVLQTAPVISNVINMNMAFMNCVSLTGTIFIKVGEASFIDVFKGASTDINASLDILYSGNVGEETKINGVLNTKSSNSKIYKSNVPMVLQKTVSIGAPHGSDNVKAYLYSGNKSDNSNNEFMYFLDIVVTSGYPMVYEYAIDRPWNDEDTEIKLVRICGDIDKSIDLDLDYYFHRCGFKTSPNLPSNTQTINNCFFNCINLTDVPSLPDNITHANSAFENDGILKTVFHMPKNLTHAISMFGFCSSLLSQVSEFGYIKIPPSVIDITSMFIGCFKLESVAMENSSNNIIMNSAFYKCYALSTFPLVPKGVFNMSNTFYECSSLTGEMLFKADSPTIYYSGCFNSASINPGALLVVNYTINNQSEIDAIIATKENSASNIIKGVIINDIVVG